MSVNKSSIWTLLPAAGLGQRAGEGLPKQYRLLDQKPVICRTLDRLLAVDGLSGVAVGVAADDEYWQKVCPQHPYLLKAYVGGVERADTVLRGLQYLRLHGAAEQDWVLVHDAVRPCVRVADVHKLLQAVLDGAGETAAGGLLAVPLTDTLKRADLDGAVAQTVLRQHIWRALTPQCFRLGNLESALMAATSRSAKPTDEAEAMEWAGGKPLLVRGHGDNIKITFAEDLAMAEQILRLQREQ